MNDALKQLAYSERARLRAELRTVEKALTILDPPKAKQEVKPTVKKRRRNGTGRVSKVSQPVADALLAALPSDGTLITTKDVRERVPYSQTVVSRGLAQLKREKLVVSPGKGQWSRRVNLTDDLHESAQQHAQQQDPVPA